jgi:L-amino acid N-acyltransferase YncA
MDVTPGAAAGARIRAATPADAEPLLAIYRPVVLDTAVSFELEPPAVAEFRARIEESLARFAWIVAERDGAPIGYAYATAHRARGAYRWSVETSVYVGERQRGQGVGRALYDALLPILARSYCNAYAGITLPNDASVALHRAAGFEPVGVFRAVGRKFGRWHDVSWWHLRLRAEPPEGP